MLTLTNGFKKPQTNDRGSSLFQALEDNWQKVNDHTHNGVNSEKLETKDLTKGTQTITSGSWVLDADDVYKQTVTLPTGHTYDSMVPSFKLSTGEIIHPTIEKVTSTTYDIYINDNTKDVVITYG